jgi:hypothetical protein
MGNARAEGEGKVFMAGDEEAAELFLRQRVP